MKTNQNILFVDDDNRLLTGLKRALSNETQVGLYFASKGSSAIEIMKHNRIDVVVSGYKAQDMTGDKLLKRVKESNPESVRMMFTGYENDLELKQHGSGLVHRHISRPCSSSSIIDMIKSIGSKWNDIPKQYRAIAAGMANLNFLPETKAYINQKKTLDLKDKALIKLLSADLGFISWAIRHAQNKFYDIQCSGIEDLVTKLCDKYGYLHNGFLKNNCVRCYDESLILGLQRRVYKHSCLVAEHSFRVAGNMMGECSWGVKSLLAGMLHDAGKLLIAQQHTQQYRLLERNSNQHSQRLQQEQHDFGTTHAKAGAMLLDLWGLHDDIVQAVLNHHNPKYKNESSLTAVLYKANILASDNTKNGSCSNSSDNKMRNVN